MIKTNTQTHSVTAGPQIDCRFFEPKLLILTNIWFENIAGDWNFLSHNVNLLQLTTSKSTSKSE